MNITRVCFVENKEQQLVGHVLQIHGDHTARKEKGVRGATPSVNQMAKIEQVAIVGHRPKKNYGLQNTSPLQRTHKIRIGKLLIDLFLPTKPKKHQNCAIQGKVTHGPVEEANSP